MKKGCSRLIALFAITAVITFTVQKDVKAYNPTTVYKYDATVTDNAVNSFGLTYDQYIPAAVRVAFESEGGKVIVIPHNMVDSRVDLSGWSGGSLNNVTGYLDVNSGAPALYVNSKTVDLANRYNPETYKKVMIHEMGHYVCLEANKIRNGYYSYTFSQAMQAAFQTEYNGYKNTPGMLAVLTSSFQRNSSISEYYANVFAAMFLDPANAQAAFPNTCAAIMADLSTINAKFGSQQVAVQQLSAQQIQAQQLAAAQAAQAAAEAQALQILQAQAAQTKDPQLARQAAYQLSYYYAVKNGQ